MDVASSLTPALSLWERGKRSQRHGEATTGFRSNILEFYETSQRLFLLPWGEGQDEGEGDVNLVGNILK